MTVPPASSSCGCTLDELCDEHGEQLAAAEREALRPSYDHDDDLPPAYWEPARDRPHLTIDQAAGFAIRRGAVDAGAMPLPRDHAW